MLAHRRLKIVVPFSALLVAVTSWHYVDCAKQTPRGWQFMGVTYNQRDQNTYLTWMAQARAGRFFFDNFYTGEKEKPSYCNVFWWTLGTFSRITGLSLISVYHGSRILLSFVLLLLLDRFIAYFLQRDDERWCAFLLIALGTGFGGLLILFSPLSKQVLLSADLWIPEAFVFLSMLWFPHFLFALILQVGIYWLFLAACERGKTSWSIGAGLMTLLLGFTHTYHLPTVYLVTLTFALLQRIRDESIWKRLGPPAIVIVLSLPALIYFSYVTHTSPSMAAWKQQNVCRSPAIWWYALGLGTIAVLPLLFPQQLWAIKDKSPRQLFLLTWILCNAALLYSSPLLPFERRLAQGLQIPLTLLSVQIAFRVMKLHQPMRRPLFILAWVTLSLPTSLFHLTVTSFRILPPRSPEYLSPSELQAAATLRRVADTDTVILAPVQQGTWLPLLTQRRVFVGHPGLTANYREKSRLTARFFSGKMNRPERERFLHVHRVKFIYWDKRGKQPSLINPSWAQVFRSSEVEIYALQVTR